MHFNQLPGVLVQNAKPGSPQRKYQNIASPPYRSNTQMRNTFNNTANNIKNLVTLSTNGNNQQLLSSTTNTANLNSEQQQTQNTESIQQNTEILIDNGKDYRKLYKSLKTQYEQVLQQVYDIKEAVNQKSQLINTYQSSIKNILQVLKITPAKSVISELNQIQQEIAKDQNDTFQLHNQIQIKNMEIHDYCKQMNEFSKVIEELKQQQYEFQQQQIIKEMHDAQNAEMMNNIIIKSDTNMFTQFKDLQIQYKKQENVVQQQNIQLQKMHELEQNIIKLESQNLTFKQQNDQLLEKENNKMYFQSMTVNLADLKTDNARILKENQSIKEQNLKIIKESKHINETLAAYKQDNFSQKKQIDKIDHEKQLLTQQLHIYKKQLTEKEEKLCQANYSLAKSNDQIQEQFQKEFDRQEQKHQQIMIDKEDDFKVIQQQLKQEVLSIFKKLLQVEKSQNIVKQQQIIYDLDDIYDEQEAKVYTLYKKCEIQRTLLKNLFKLEIVENPELIIEFSENINKFGTNLGVLEKLFVKEQALQARPSRKNLSTEDNEATNLANKLLLRSNSNISQVYK